jgi:hypothetical protein
MTRGAFSWRPEGPALTRAGTERRKTADTVSGIVFLNELLKKAN